MQKWTKRLGSVILAAMLVVSTVQSNVVWAEETEVTVENRQMKAAETAVDFRYEVSENGEAVTITGYTGKGEKAVIPETKSSEITISEATVDFRYEVSEDGEAVTITGYTGEGGKAVIPETIDGKKVTSIGEYAFLGCSDLTSIEIPESVTCIGEAAFIGCSGLTSIKVAETNEIYDSRENCNAIIEKETNKLLQGCQTTKIPGSVMSIGDSAFLDCSSLTDIEIPGSVTSIGEAAFYNCSGLTDIKILGSVTSIGEAAFYNCSSLTDIEIPESVTSIGDSAFLGCSSLTGIEIPGSMTSKGTVYLKTVAA